MISQIHNPISQNERKRLLYIMYKNRGARLLASRVPRARARVIISSFVFFACCRGWRRNGWASARVLRSSGAPRRSSTRPRDPDTTPTRAHEKPAHTRLSIQNATAHTSPPRKRSDPAHRHHHLQVHKSQEPSTGWPTRQTSTRNHYCSTRGTLPSGRHSRQPDSPHALSGGSCRHPPS
jgi:hypothetical protein